jgi:hypothetical protein
MLISQMNTVVQVWCSIIVEDTTVTNMIVRIFIGGYQQNSKFPRTSGSLDKAEVQTNAIL